MSGNEYSQKEYMAELNATVKELTNAVIDLRVLIASEYVKKTDCENCKKSSDDLKTSNDSSHFLLTGWIVGAYVYITTVLGVIIALKK